MVFLIGSVLCGQSRNMGMLIAFRAVQGAGGGGLMVLTQAIIGEPRRLKRVEYILNNSFGMLGINSVVIIKKFSP